MRTTFVPLEQGGRAKSLSRIKGHRYGCPFILGGASLTKVEPISPWHHPAFLFALRCFAPQEHKLYCHIAYKHFLMLHL